MPRSLFFSVAPVALAALSVVATSATGCSSGGATTGTASAAVVTNRAQLVGGDRALGDVGDYIIENDRIRVIVQKPGFSRGFGVYGGSLIDADLRRPSETGTSAAAPGNDQFGELFPCFFVQAVNVSTVFVSADGSDGGPARITAVGEAGDFLELAAILNRAVTGSNVDFQSLKSQAQIRYTITYELAPGRNDVAIALNVQNVSPNVLKFPSDFAVELLGLAKLGTKDFTVPVGDVGLFGATSSVFMPGIGFDSRFGLQESYERKVDFPAFPGLVTEWIASRGAGASYGLAAAPSPRNFVMGKKDIYDDGQTEISDTTMLVPFSASSFLGVFYDSAPAQLAPGEAFETRKHFIVGSGDVGSVLDGIHKLRGARTGTLGGQVFDRVTGVPSVGTQVLVYQRKNGTKKRIYSEYDVREDGSFSGTLPPGAYSLRVAGEARPLGAFVDFDIAEGVTTPVRLESTPPGRVVVTILDTNGLKLPSKASAVGTYEAENTQGLTRQFLFDLQAGERFRPSDLVDDDPGDPNTRSYIENVAFTRDGIAELYVRPGAYEIVASRGPEYSRASSLVTVGPGETRSVAVALARVVDTRGWVAGDLHVHSKNSIDSAMSLDERVAALAAEGVEWAVATDHNFVTDYRPYVARNQLLEWLYPMVGLEMTTLESGHFNGYPLRYDPGPITHGAFAWAGRTPDALFEDLRALGSLGPARTIVQVNHPRDGVLGYFSQYQRDAYTAGEMPPTLVQQVIAPKGPAFRTPNGATTFSTRFDAIEVANGKLFGEMHHFRVPDVLPAGNMPASVPPAGSIVRKAANGAPGFPGAIEDWFNLLNLGERFIAVGTGDTHSGSDEAGQFRTMVFVGDDRPITLTENRLVDAMQSRRVVATNGPLIDFYIDDAERGVMGRTLVNSREDGQVNLGFRLTAAPWMSVARLNIWRNGTIAKVITVDPNRDLAHDAVVDVVTLELAKDAANAFIDSWFVLEAIGYRSLFPVIKPLEVPPVLLTEAVATLAGPLGLGSDEFGALRPPEVFAVTAWAMTNPVWVTRKPSAFVPPGPVPVEVLNRPENDPKMQAFVYPRSTIKAAPKRLMKAESQPTDRFEPRGKVPLFYPRADNPFDVRKALSRFGHLNGHAE